ncbi:MAG: GyrI-like domain-containing protein [Bacteroidales bacterium]|jgi:effector-binding domain-containing protein|nr:GyrI-like domain-containing protein [Bacteroidales bacterium]MDD4214525.1 GyrI-like domain-containing protein [Bacteroidales bacterium]
MKFIKKLFVALLVLIIILLVVAIFLPSKKHIEDSASIKSPAKIIYEQVVKMKSWDKWSPFKEGDTAMKITYEGPAQGVGSIMKWESKKQGKGMMTILETEPYKYIKTKLEFEGQGTSYSNWLFTEEGDSTKVTWTIDIEGLNYPVGRLMGVFMTGILHKSFQTGLDNLKKVSEEYLIVLNTFKTSDITIKEMEKQYAIYIMDSSKCSEVDVIIGKLFGEIFQFLGMNKIECTSPPFARYLVWDEKADRNVLEAGTFIKAPVEGNERVKFQEIPAQKYARAMHTGAYETVYNTYTAIEKYIKDHNLTPAGPPMEIYITDPEKETDMTKWETEVLYPIK